MGTTRTRSAEQTARLLLSNAFRYDTWECMAARHGTGAESADGGPATTAKLRFTRESLAALSHDAVGLSLTFFDRDGKAFVGAAKRLTMAEAAAAPLVFRARPALLLCVEVLVSPTRSHAPLEALRVTQWGYLPVAQLPLQSCVELRPGNAHVLLLDEALWPAESAAGATAVGTLAFFAEVDADPTLAELMRQLVPPGVFVEESFTTATPSAGARPFRLALRQIQLSGSTASAAAGLADPRADWSVAAVAHNGYQQLGEGAEVPLVRVLDETSSSSSSGGSSSSSSSSPKQAGAVRLCSELPLSIDGLPVHSATAVVLAIRRRAPGAAVFTVVGFSVFPLCMLPMKDRDVRVENLPALRGPFSCDDARMLMVESASPYGKVPLALTMTVEYHDTDVPAAPLSEAAGASSPHSPSSPRRRRPHGDEGGMRPHEDGDVDMRSSVSKRSSGGSSYSSSSSSHSSRLSAAAPPPPPQTATLQPESTAAPGMPFVVASGAADGSAGTTPAAAAAGVGAQPTHAAADATAGEDVYRMLCRIMEELQKVRAAQDALLRPAAAAPSRALQEALSGRLADAAVEWVDLTPTQTALSWEARRAMQEGLQPLLHPVTGERLDDTAPATGALPVTLCGMRLEGVSLDASLQLPEDVCLMFSFGPLPLQQVGPLRATRLPGSTPTLTSYQFAEGDSGRPGFVWFEPLESTANASMRLFKEEGGGALLYLHLYDALTMFYVATAPLALDRFQRPYRSACGLAALDLPLQRDLSMTEERVPSPVLPLVRHAGQLHLTVAAVGAVGAAGPSAVMHAPDGGSRVVVAKRRATLSSSPSPSPPPEDSPPTTTTTTAAAAATPSASASLHWQRAQAVKAELRDRDFREGPSPAAAGVPGPHLQAAQARAELEVQLRMLERERDAHKSRLIAEALRARRSVRHEVHAASWRPLTVRTPFKNPYSQPAQFFVEVADADADHCRAAAPSFFVGPREAAEVALVLCLHGRPHTRALKAAIYSERRELVLCIDITAHVGPPLVDRRYEIYGPAGSTVERTLFSRVYAAFSLATPQRDLQRRLAALCTTPATSAAAVTSVATRAVLDPITQTAITAWEEAVITTTIPSAPGKQRVEYVTLFKDRARQVVYETWELCVFACEALTSREVAWGQSTTLGLPAGDSDALYCSDPRVQVGRHGPTYLLTLDPPEENTAQRLLLHTLEPSGTLRKTLLTVPVVAPTPTYSTVLELSLADTTSPIFRRLTFVNRGDREERFHVHHNYRYQLRVDPSSFVLAPGDTQHIALQLDMLQLPPGQTEGRFPMWVFINAAEGNKTVESYQLQVVLRTHRAITVA